MSVTTVEHGLAAPNLDAYRNGEMHLSPDERVHVMVRYITVAAFESLLAREGYAERHAGSLATYLSHVRPVIEQYVDPTKGVNDANVYIRDMHHIAQAYNGGDLPDDSVEGQFADDAVQAYGELGLSNGQRLPASAEIALWMLFIATPEETAAFCETQGLQDHMVDANDLAHFLANTHIDHNAAIGRNAMFHLAERDDVLRHYIKEYAEERRMQRESAAIN